ncbi:heme ABC transporter substrate-binding protein IsdE [Paenibacillus massiliensis]|uniref:heme ABC transporter substrate-binding protein IsdE n=1 Tax=Paenibacillus massiliensis TaxID=225917 RepID=UPI0004B4E736|nr:heme ABC transporter substrate-binding protein IsdE [Paenibacillus massiliensis]
MLKKRITLFLCAAMLAMLPACAVRAKTDSNAASTQQPRIISTSAALCMILDKLELDLVGVPDTAFTLPERYKDSVEIGQPMTPDLEIIKSLRPTDVISPNTLQYDLQPQYEGIQVPATFVNLGSVEGMLKSTEQLGVKYDRTKQAEVLRQQFEAYMAELRTDIADQAKPKVLILMGLPGSYMVATEKSYAGNLVKLAGGDNVLKDQEEALLTLNTEALSKLDPDIILRTSHAMPEMVQEMFREEFATSDIWKHFRAVQAGDVYDLSNERFGMSANLNYQEALDELRAIFYGEPAHES